MGYRKTDYLPALLRESFFAEVEIQNVITDMEGEPKAVFKIKLTGSSEAA
jgi:hypothetical protein